MPCLLNRTAASRCLSPQLSQLPNVGPKSWAESDEIGRTHKTIRSSAHRSRRFGMLALLLPNALSFELSLVRSRSIVQASHSPSSLIVMKAQALPDSPADLDDDSCYLIDTDEGFVPRLPTLSASQCTHSAHPGPAGASTSAPTTRKSWHGLRVERGPGCCTVRS